MPPADRASLRRPSLRKSVRFARSAEMCPAPEGAWGTPRRFRFLPSFIPYRGKPAVSNHCHASHCSLSMPEIS